MLGGWTSNSRSKRRGFHLHSGCHQGRVGALRNQHDPPQLDANAGRSMKVIPPQPTRHTATKKMVLGRGTSMQMAANSHGRTPSYSRPTPRTHPGPHKRHRHGSPRSTQHHHDSDTPPQPGGYERSANTQPIRVETPTNRMNPGVFKEPIRALMCACSTPGQKTPPVRRQPYRFVNQVEDTAMPALHRQDEGLAGS
jgi:hypothetical protein